MLGDVSPPPSPPLRPLEMAIVINELYCGRAPVGVAREKAGPVSRWD